MKKVIDKLKKENGSYSIEAGVLMIIVFMIVLLLIVMGHIIYEQTRLNAIMQDAAERAAVVYSVAGKDMVTGRVDGSKFKDKSPYWRLFDLNQSSRGNTVKNYALMKMNAFRMNSNKYVKGNIKVTYNNYFIYKRVKVELVNVKYKVPFGGFLSLFIETDYPIYACAEAAVNEQAEMIRNVDMVVDIFNELVDDTGIGGLLEKYKDKISKISG